MLKVPEGKTKVRLISDLNLDDRFKYNDQCYIESVCRGVDNIPYLVLVRLIDGYIGHASSDEVEAVDE